LSGLNEGGKEEVLVEIEKGFDMPENNLEFI